MVNANGKTSQLLLIPLSLVVVLYAVGIVWQVWRAMTPSRYEVAVYQGMSFEIRGGKYNDFSSGGDEHIADIWIEIQDIGVLRLQELQEEHVAHLTNVSRPQPGNQDSYCRHNSNTFKFEGGKLTYVRLDGTYDQFRIGLSKEGPFYNVPLDIATAERVFGKPLRYEEYSRSFR